nr:histone deacetylase 14 [Tanacetum cinerariifolium]
MKDKRNLSRHTTGKKMATLILIPSIRFTKLIIHHLQRRHRFHPRPDSPLYLSNEEPVLRYLKFSAKGTKREVFGMSILDSLITVGIRQATYYREYLAKATETTDKPAKAKRFKRSISRKTCQPRSSPKSVGASEAEEVPAKEPQHKKTGPVDQYIFQRRVSKSPYDVLGQSDSEEESEKIVLGAKKGSQDEGQAGPNPDAQAEDQTGSDDGAEAEGQAGSNPNETSEGQAGSNPDETSEGQA